MNPNVAGYDRVARLVIGAALLIVAIAGSAGVVTLAVSPLPQALTAAVLLVLGAILVVTGAVQRCPIWAALRIDTLRGG